MANASIIDASRARSRARRLLSPALAATRADMLGALAPKLDRRGDGADRGVLAPLDTGEGERNDRGSGREAVGCAEPRRGVEDAERIDGLAWAEPEAGELRPDRELLRAGDVDRGDEGADR